MSQFEKLCKQVFEKLGAVPHPSYGNRFMTLAGPLDAAVYDGWIATLFEDIALARAILGTVGEGAINPHSGKWNTHFYDSELKFPGECAKKVFRRLAGVLPVPELYGADQRVSEQKPYSPDKPSQVVLQYLYRAGGKSAQRTVVFQPDDCAVIFDARALIYASEAKPGKASLVPGLVGLEDLQAEVSSWDPEQDPPFHEITGITWTQSEDATDARTFDEFVDDCVAVALSKDGWSAAYRLPMPEAARQVER